MVDFKEKSEIAVTAVRNSEMWRDRPSRLLEAPRLERRDIAHRQLEPLPVRSPIGESPMPVGFDAGRVVRRNDVHKLGLVRQRDPDFLHPVLKLVAASDLVVSALLDQVDRFVSRSARWTRCRSGWGGRQDGHDVRELWLRTDPLAQSFGEPDTAEGT